MHVIADDAVWVGESLAFKARVKGRTSHNPNPIQPIMLM